MLPLTGLCDFNRKARLLAPVLPSLYSPKSLALGKVCIKCIHSGSPRHAFAHCGGFAPAAPRRAWGIVSVPISGSLLSQPVPVVGLVGRCPANCLMGHCAIVRRFLWAIEHSSFNHLPGIILSFPRLSLTSRQVHNVLLSCTPPRGRFAWLSRILIAVASGRINRNYECGFLAPFQVLLHFLLSSLFYSSTTYPFSELYSQWPSSNLMTSIRLSSFVAQMESGLSSLVLCTCSDRRRMAGHSTCQKSAHIREDSVTEPSAYVSTRFRNLSTSRLIPFKPPCAYKAFFQSPVP